MLTFALRLPRFVVAAALTVLLTVSPPSGAATAQSAPPAQFAEQLAAGEFAPALEAALRVDDPRARDALLKQLAEAQARAGGRDQALHTLAAMSDDRTRAATIESTLTLARESSAAGGGAQADFDTLIDLITATVAPTTWDSVGGAGSMSPFQNGVYVDTDGMLRLVKTERPATGLATAHLAALRGAQQVDPRLLSGLRKVSLTRLEKHVQLRLASGRALDDEMRNLAGLERIQFLLVYPESGDLVLAGPAGPWRADEDGRVVGIRSGRPLVQLDDLVVMLRLVGQANRAAFACSINPSQEGLARTRAVAEKWSQKSLKPSQRGAYLNSLREALGRQSITVEGIDAGTRAAKVLVEADYRMKLVGMGLEPGTVDVPSYLELIRLKPGQSPPPLDVLRWWFTLRYDEIRTTADRNAFELRGTGAGVLSENELLSQLGERVHTGASSVSNQEFANRFTQHFEKLAAKYPIYADLQNVFSLAMVCALIQSAGLAERVGWHQTCFGPGGAYEVAIGTAPQAVESVINHRKIGDKHLVVGVSGGVRAEPWRFTTETTVRTESQGTSQSQRLSSTPPTDLLLSDWWWD